MDVLRDDEQTRFGPYRIVRRIGTGGMGSVFEAQDIGLGHHIALKLLHPHVAERPGAARRFLREGRAAARIRHPHVVQVFALGTERDRPFLAMELLDGGNLSGIIADKGRLSVGDALDLVLPIVAAVAAAHDAGVIHRDLKPSNVGIATGPAAQRWPKVLDFGVSKVLSGVGVHEATVTEGVVGTAAYMAPEQARAACNASFLSDQYSLAVMVYQCITGELPFAGRSLYEVLESVMAAPVRLPSTRARDIPPALDDAILRAMSRIPGDRFPSVRGFGAALLAVASERARAAYGTELGTVEAMDSVVPVAREATGDPLASGMPTPVGDSTAPPTETAGKRRPLEATRHARWLALAVLMGGAIATTTVAMRTRHEGTPLSGGLAVPAPPPAFDSLARQDLARPTVEPSEPSSSSSSSPTASAAPDRTSSPTAAHPRGPGRPDVRVSYGLNGAPILP